MNRLTRIGCASLAAAAAAVCTAVPIASGQPGIPHAVPTFRVPHSHTTNQIIVKLKGGVPADVMASPLNSRLKSMGWSRASALSVSAGVPLTPFRIMGTGAHVLRLDHSYSNEEVAQIARRLAQDPSVEYAEPDSRQFPMQAFLFPPTNTTDTDYGNIPTANLGTFVGQWYLWGHGAAYQGVVYYGINAEAAYTAGAFGSTINVAVIDTGLAANPVATPHPDIIHQFPTGELLGTTLGYDFISAGSIAYDNDPRDGDATDTGDFIAAGDPQASDPDCGGVQDSSWHGTHTAGLIAAEAGNGVGIVGVANQATVVPLRVLGKCGGQVSDISDAILWAGGGTVAGGNPAGMISPTIQVINLSLAGFGTCPTSEQTAITAALGGTVKAIVAAAGNGGNDDANNYAPANCTGVIAVAATDHNGAMTNYTSIGTNVTVSAPGGWFPGNATNQQAQYGIWSLWNPGADGNGGTTAVAWQPGTDNVTDYVWFAGTSEATALVSGTVALMLSAQPTLNSTEVINILTASARGFPDCSCGGSGACGTGIVDAGASVNNAINNRGIAPGHDATCTGSTVTLSGTVFNDKNNNNVQDSGEQGLAGVTIVWSTSDTTVIGTGLPVTLGITTTDANGNYTLTGVRALSSSIVAYAPSGYSLRAGTTGSLGAGTSNIVPANPANPTPQLSYVASIPVAATSGTGYNFPASSTASSSGSGGGGGGCVAAPQAETDLVFPLCVLAALAGLRRRRPLKDV